MNPSYPPATEMVTEAGNPNAPASRSQASDPVPPVADLAALAGAAHSCRACPLYRKAIQTVFGAGPPDAHLFLIGEQPGAQEDRAGHPFVGPAGRMLDRALAAAGVDREKCYVTNAVKHFKWEKKGKLHMHQTPVGNEIMACKPWLAAELAFIHPQVIVCMGATAARAVFGPAVRVLRDRGKSMPSNFCDQTVVTIHPSSLLRIPNQADQAVQFPRFVEDLRFAASLLR